MPTLHADSPEFIALALFKGLGNLDDLPEELQNTVSNVYWRAFNPQSLPATNTMADQLLKEYEIGQNLKALEYTEKFIATLRGLMAKRIEDEDFKEFLVKDWISVAIGWLKYGMPVHNKSYFRRKIEMKFKKPVYEIPDLYETLKPFFPTSSRDHPGNASTKKE